MWIHMIDSLLKHFVNISENIVNIFMQFIYV
jgi:hypothetical protein